MSSPKHHVPKRYLATTAAPITAELIETLRNGVQLHDEPVPIAAVECVQVAELQLEIVLAQGKYHQVKRMLAAAGNHCAALKRISIGELRLASLSLAEGEWCYLEQDQLNLLK
jgi:16S rRNA pseudouridine516 synthase